jgi:hypothetical protein
MKLFSDLSGDFVAINDRYYQEFCDAISEARFYDEDKINDLVYYTYDVFEEFEMDITKRRLLLKIADIADVISFDDIMELKHFELKRLLDANKNNYSKVFHNIIADISPKFDIQ